jgi:hypothetical protein
MWVTGSAFHVIRRFRLKVFAHRMLKKILRPKRKERRKEGRKEGRNRRMKKIACKRSVTFCSPHKIFLT